MHVRSVLWSVLVAALLTVGGLAGALAQDATPAGDMATPDGGMGMPTPPDALFADTMGLPELTVTLTDAGYEGLPAETPAGMYVVTFTNSTPGDENDPWAAEFIQLPEGMTADDVAATMASMAQAPEGDMMASPEAGMEGMDMASPEAGMEGMDMASPEAGGEDPLAWLYTTYAAGGPGAFEGQTVQGIVDLRPGNYIVSAGDPSAPFPSAALTVTGDAAASPAAADMGATPMVDSMMGATATITEVGSSGSFDFQVSGSLAAGPAVLQISNQSDQPHFVFAFWSPVELTDEQVMAFLMAEPGTMPEGVPAEAAQVRPAFYAGSQSTNSTQYLAANIETGYYILLCFIPDPQKGGVPHSFDGMIEVVPAS